MANPTWKKIEQSRPAWAAKLLYKRVSGKELFLRRDIRAKTIEMGGWEFVPAMLGPDSIVYSLGVGEDLDFDLELVARYGCQVYAFDPTPSTARWIEEQTLPDRLHYYPWAVTAEDGTLRLYPRRRADGTASDVMYTFVEADGVADAGVDVPAYSVPTLAGKLGHDRIDVLKLDIEGAEYGVLAGMLAMTEKPRQVLVEFHHRFAGIDKRQTAATVAALRAADYQLFAISKTGRELSFLLPPPPP